MPSPQTSPASALERSTFEVEYLTPAQASRITGLSVKTLEALRAKRNGPAFFKVGRLVRYRLADVRAWVEKERVACKS